MIIDKITIQNFRCLLETFTPLSDFTTIIGENNSGKSSFLESLIIFIRGTKLSPQDYYDSSKGIVITVYFKGITDEILNSLVPEHKERIVELVQDQRLTLIRRFAIDGSSSIKCIRAIPIERRLKPEYIDEIFKGKRGGQIRVVVNEIYPEIADQLDKETQTRAKELINDFILTLPKIAFKDEESPLPTGIDASIKNLFPEPVYIPAVKDLTDDIKTKESTSFGQLLKILLNVIEDQLVDAEETFASLNKKLNRILKPDGNYEDERLQEIKEIEQTVEQFVQENFPSTRIKFLIPPPEIKTILSSAKISVNDGVEGEADTKGDGLKRAITFAILRTYVTFAARPDWQIDSGRTSPKDRYLFLFEEPELYLHPTAQRILFDALNQISQTHQVIISTHSPIFLSPEMIGTFIKMIKRVNKDGHPPFSEALPISLDDLSTRDQFQLICYNNNNPAFFSERVVFVEGDSDQIVLNHVAKILNPKWDFKFGKVSFVRVNGKGSIERYRHFFEKFDVRTYVISDLDILIRGFDKLVVRQS